MRYIDANVDEIMQCISEGIFCSLVNNSPFEIYMMDIYKRKGGRFY